MPAPRLGTPRCVDRPTFGPQVAAVAETLGLPLTPWQRHVADVALEYELVDLRVMHGGVCIYTVKVPRLIYREVRLWVPRQSGKTVLLVALLVWRCLFGQEVFFPDADDYFGRSAQWVMFFSTNGQHAKHKWEDEHVPLLQAAEELEGEFAVRRNNGHEAFVWTNESLWQRGAGTEKAGHGDPIDTVAADEFFAQIDDRIENGARMTMVTRRSPQIWFVSTFGDVKPDKDDDAPVLSGPLWKKVDDSRARCASGKHGPVASFEYSAADFDSPDLDPGDEDLWLRTMPGLEENGGIIPRSAVRADYESMKTTPGGLKAFKRAYLNLRQPPDAGDVPALISPKAWSRVVDEDSELAPRPDRLALGVAVDFDDREAALVITGPRKGSGKHVELILSKEGSDWLLDEIAAKLVRNPITDLGLDTGGPAGRYLVELEEICKRAKVKLHKYTGRSYAAACEAFRQQVHGVDFTNNGSSTLAAAVDAGVKRQLGDVWVWDRKTPTATIAALDAATVSLRAFDEAELKKRRSAYDDDDEGEETAPVRAGRRSSYEEDE